MFTGIIEEVGIIRAIKKGGSSAVLTIEAKKLMEDMAIGDSIAVNGICLTAASISAAGFTADVMHETLRRSSLLQLHGGSHVNLERAMPAGGRFGGHIVTGHIDGTGVIVSLTKDDNAVWYTVRTTAAVSKYIVEKGSIAMDGISLTVAEVTGELFRVSVIPHTYQNTILCGKKAGDTVNLENDCIGKYVEKLLKRSEQEDKS